MVKKRIDVNFDILVLPVVLYLFALFFIVSFLGYEQEDHSAMRMMYHIFPVIVFGLYAGVIGVLNTLLSGHRVPHLR